MVADVLELDVYGGWCAAVAQWLEFQKLPPDFEGGIGYIWYDSGSFLWC